MYHQLMQYIQNARDSAIVAAMDHRIIPNIHFGGSNSIEVHDKDYTLESLNGPDKGYPYSSYFMPEPDVMMSNLTNISFDSDNVVEGGPTRRILKRYFPRDHILTDSTSNHYTESVRIKCQFNKFSTPYDTWVNKIRDEVELRLKSGDKLKYREVFEMIYNNEDTRICNTFNEAYCVWMIKSAAERMNVELKDVKLLDPSSGWGNRLIASYACNIAKYRGYDPNPKLTPLYKDIVKGLDNQHTKVTIDEAPFEESDEKSKSYDIVLTSPPYFAYEVYDEGEGQSVTKFPEYDEWVTNMYRPYLTKAYTYLKTGGIIIIYIEDIFMNKQRYPLSQLTNDIIGELGGAEDMSYGLDVVYEDQMSRSKHKKKGPRARYAKSWIKTDRTSGRMSRMGRATTRIDLTPEEKRVEHEIKLGNFTDLRSADRKNLERIMKDRRVMQTVGNGKVWDDKKIDRFFMYAKKDEKQDPGTRDSFYNFIVLSDEGKKSSAIGIIGIHKVWGYSLKTKDKFFVTVFIDHDYHGQGIGRKAIRLAVDHFHKLRQEKVYAHVGKDNIASAKSLEKAGFVRDESIDDKIGKNGNIRVLIGYVYENQMGGDSEPETDNDNRVITIRAVVEWLDYDIFKEVLNRRANEVGREIEWLTNDSKYSDVLLLDGKYMYDKKYYDCNSDLKGRLMAKGLTDKIILHKALIDTASDHIPETHVINNRTTKFEVYNDGAWIWRPEGGFSGRGIEYIESADRARELAKGLGQNKSALLSRVIKDPMLYYYYPPDSDTPGIGHKFHFRIYIIVYKTQNNLSAYLVNEGEIAVAKLGYVDSDYDNPDIHNSRFQFTIGRPKFPMDYANLGHKNSRMQLKDTSLVLESMKDILFDVIEIPEVHNTIQVYEESNAGMEILGCDFMMDYTGKIYLIEINSKVSLSRELDTREWLNKLLSNALYECVIGPRYFGHDTLEYSQVIIQRTFDSISGSGGEEAGDKLLVKIE